MNYLTNGRKTISFKSRAGKEARLKMKDFRRAIKHTHSIIDRLAKFGVNVFRLIGLRNTSAFIGELYAASLIKTTGHRFVANPHQDGYPDLLHMDVTGRRLYTSLKSAGKLGNKKPFSPFRNGGLEVKATCGDVPTPERCKAAGLKGKPGLGDQRIKVLQQFNWKSHHRQTTNLVGVYWDFMRRKPRIVAVFFSSTLNATDWGRIVHPKEGGGRTTSVSIMKSKGVLKMSRGWLLVVDDERYAAAINRICGETVIPIA